MHGIYGWSLNQGQDSSQSIFRRMLDTACVQGQSYNIEGRCSSEHALTGEITNQGGAGRDSVWVAYTGHLRRDNDPSSKLDAEQLAGLYQQHTEGLPNILQGHFSLAIVDNARKYVLLVTDWMGTHPCYYYTGPEGIVFASSLAALVKHPCVPAEIEPQAIYNYMYFHCVPGPKTVYRNIHKLRPGEMLTYSNGKLTLKTYWQPDYEKAVGRSNEEALAAQLRANLEQSVVEYGDQAATGAFLSGGLDSSTVAGMFARTSQQPVDTFTIGFDIAGYDESAFARISSEHFNTTHHEYFVTPDDVCQIVPEIAARYDEPFGNSSVVPTYFCAKMAREHGMSTLLAGDGGDELFAGNERYVRQKVFEYYFQLPAFLRGALDLPYQLLPPLRTLFGTQKLYSYITQAKDRLPDRLQSYNFLHRISPDEVFAQDFIQNIDESLPLAAWRDRYNEAQTESSLKRMLYLDWKFTLADNDLMKVNTMCDLAGMQVRYPMLDNRLIDLSLTVPDEMLMPGHKLRHFYKQALRGFLPEQTLNKSKHGFGLPFGVWMRDHRNLQEMAYDSIQSLKQQPYFNPQFLDQAIQMHREGTAGYYGELVWILMILQLWIETHRTQS